MACRPDRLRRYHRSVADSKLHERLAPEPEIRDRVEHPKMWKVLLHNDDYTTQEFVVWVLETIFNMPHADAYAVMMHVHKSGIGVAGLFTRDVAETKVKATERLAEQHEYPLRVTIEPETPEPRE
jgi:ATP-dependent Clp protease adaptor protein ClpS